MYTSVCVPVRRPLGWDAVSDARAATRTAGRPPSRWVRVSAEFGGWLMPVSVCRKPGEHNVPPCTAVGLFRRQPPGQALVRDCGAFAVALHHDLGRIGPGKAHTLCRYRIRRCDDDLDRLLRQRRRDLLAPNAANIAAVVGALQACTGRSEYHHQSSYAVLAVQAVFDAHRVSCQPRWTAWVKRRTKTKSKTPRCA